MKGSAIWQATSMPYGLEWPQLSTVVALSLRALPNTGTLWGKSVQNAPTYRAASGSREPESRKQDVKTFLGKVMIVREHVRQPFVAHGFHGDTVGEAVGFVQA